MVRLVTNGFLAFSAYRTPKHSISQPPVHLCFAQVIELIAHPEITQILSFHGDFHQKWHFAHPKFDLHTLSCHFWLNLCPQGPISEQLRFHVVLMVLYINMEMGPYMQL